MSRSSSGIESRRKGAQTQIGKRIYAKDMKEQGMFGGWLLVHCGRSIRCVKAEVGDETRERGWDLDPELVPVKKRVLKDFKKEKDDLIYVLERLLWLLVEGG